MDNFDYSGWLTWLLHSLSASAILGAMIGFFPPVAAFVGIVYYLLQIYKDSVVQEWLAVRRARKIAAYRARIKILEMRTKHLPPPQE